MGEEKPLGGSRPAEGEGDILNVLIVLLKRKTMILGITFGVGLLATIVSFLLPPTYRGETRIIPPQQGRQDMASQMLGQLGGAAGLLGATIAVKTPNELYVEILKSRTILDRIIDKFKLMDSYRKKYREDARKKLLKAFKAKEEKKSGIIILSVEDRDPKKAAEMANAFVQELKSVVSGLAVTEAAQRRLFFEEQLRETKASLLRAEEEVRAFQQKTGAMQIDAQARAVIEGIAALRARIASQEVQMKVVRSYATAQNPDLQKIEEEVQGLRAELEKLETSKGKGHDPLMPTGRMVAVGTEYLRKLRDRRYYEIMFELLSKQYELARLDEARDAAVIQIVDPAVTPEKKVKPNRPLLVSLFMMMAFLVSLFVAFVLEFVEKSRLDPGKNKKMEALAQYSRFRSHC